MTLCNKPSIRILQVVGGMNRAGTETWLMHILRQINRDRFQIDFLVHTTEPCHYDHEIRTLGSKIIVCPHPHSQPWSYGYNFKQILKKHRPYDIIHSHGHHFSGYVLRLAHQLGIPVRIAHSHFDSSSVEAKTGLKRKLYLSLMKRWISQYATVGLGCSRNAAADLFGMKWENDPRWQLLYCGIDLAPFRNTFDSNAVRAELDIPADAFVLGHVGRFDAEKNHLFLLDIASEIAKREPKMRLLLVGDGKLRPEIEQKVVQIGLADRVIFAGVRSDVPRLMLGAMDLLIFPSLYEGLGLVLVEAQAAGLSCILSNVIPQEADVVKPLMHRISLLKPASTWADAVMETKQDTAKINQLEAFKTVENSLFNIQRGARELEFLYMEQLNYFSVLQKNLIVT
ncbi:glycosyltransferase [Nostoc sp. B(2019)]|nr:glycosyltransferase [Nostoc sp. B(2019)]